MIRSSVLRGQVLTRLNSAGAKQKTILNIDGRLVAVQSSVGGFNSVIWTHIDPLGMSEADETKAVYDALGNHIPWQHAPTAPPNAYNPSSPNHGGLGSLFGSAQDKSCVFNGLPISCSDLAHQIDIGNVSALVNRGAGRTRKLSLTSFGLGVYQAWVEDEGERLGDPRPNDDIVIVNKDEDGKGHYELFLLHVAPQNPPTIDNNPPTIDNSDAKNQSCQIEISFSGSYNGLPNGPTVGRRSDGQLAMALAFQ